MQIITVAPIVRGALQGSLTYFSKEPIPAGMVIIAPIRTREVPAIVLESREVSDAKTSLKSSDYAIRKISRAHPRRIWLPAFLKAVEETANATAQKFGEVLLTLTPKIILDAHINGTLNEPKINKTDGSFEIKAIQETTQMRLEAYRRLVREAFIRHESIYICVPTEDDVLRISKELERGIENYTFTFHSSLTKKRVIERWENALSEKHAILVVGTTQYLSLPRYFNTIILEEEHSNAWKMPSRTPIDLRGFIEKYARASMSTLIIGAPILRPETYERVTSGVIGEFIRIAQYARQEANRNTKTILIDPRKEEKSLRENTGRREMVLLSSELKELLQNAGVRKEKVLLLCARKGLAPVTTCGDCGTLVKCPECDAPLVIHKKESVANQTTQLFICHGCGFTRIPENNVNETCPNCGGWKLQGVGIGIDRISDEVLELSPTTPLFILDGDRAKTRSQAKKIIEQFQKSAGGILVATPMAIPLLDTIDNTAIVSVDSLFAIPDIRMSERIFALILALREKTIGALLIQTRSDDVSIFEQALSGDILQFTKNELATRKIFSYPPYGTIIKITLRGKRDGVGSEMERLKIFLEMYAPIVPGTMAREPKNIFRMHMIIKLAEDNWPNQDLLSKLRSLPMQFTIEINPDHLL
ncbi:MAG: hypothetical protein WBC83_02970 [Minisyncoccia bacterium]